MKEIVLKSFKKKNKSELQVSSNVYCISVTDPKPNYRQIWKNAKIIFTNKVTEILQRISFLLVISRCHCYYDKVEELFLPAVECTWG